MQSDLSDRIDPDGIDIRPARDAELRACRRLLPECFRHVVVPAVPECIVAVMTGADGPSLAGAAAWLPVAGAAVPTAIHVVPAARRLGIGSRLLQAVWACNPDAESLRSWDVVAEGSPGAAFLSTRGFRPGTGLLTYETTCTGLAEVVRRDHERFFGTGRGRVPGLFVVSLRMAPPDQIRNVLRSEFPALDVPLWQQIHAGDEGFDRDCSSVALFHGVVVGVLVIRFDRDLAQVSFLAVSAQGRFGVITGTLFERSVPRIMAILDRRGVPRPQQRIALSLLDSNRAMLRRPTRLGAVLTSRAHTWEAARPTSLA